MPVMDGFALVERLGADETTAVVPELLLSARAGEEARVEGLIGGADDYLVKPFGVRELVARVEAAIRLSRARRVATLRQREATTARAYAKRLEVEIVERQRVEDALRESRGKAASGGADGVALAPARGCR
ncbi:MAG: response regulator [Azospirillum sp.]|nr:response regulator [Azospirillum sp.]